MGDEGLNTEVDSEEERGSLEQLDSWQEDGRTERIHRKEERETLGEDERTEHSVVRSDAEMNRLLISPSENKRRQHISSCMIFMNS